MNCLLNTLISVAQCQPHGGTRFKSEDHQVGLILTNLCIKFHSTLFRNLLILRAILLE